MALKHNRFTGLICVVLSTLLFSGCSIGMDVEALLRPPRPTGEQQKIQKALEEYISSTQKNKTPDVSGGYVLKHPKSGEYRSAFVVKDLDGDGEEEAIVFYSNGSENKNVHLNFLKKSENKWLSVNDVEGASTDIDRIQFGDLNGDGLLETITGWNIANVRDKQLVLYKLSSSGFDEWHKELYTEFTLGSLTDSGRDSLMILHANTADKETTAKLLEAGTDKDTGELILAELGSTRLDGYIQQFTNLRIRALNKMETSKGLYADGIRGSGGMVTELIYWDGVQLRAPFYNREKNTTELTYREVSLPSMDLNGDGIIEWPIPQSLDGYTNSKGDKVWLTEWKSWDIETQKVKDEFTSVINMTDGYYLSVDESWKGLFTLSYDKKTHTLAFHSLSYGLPGEKFLVLQTIYKSAAPGLTTDLSAQSPDEEEPILQELEDMADVKFMVWFDTEKPYSLDMVRIRYMFTYLQ